MADFGSEQDTLSAAKLSLAATTVATTSTHQNWPEMPSPLVFPTCTIQLRIDHLEILRISGDNKSPWIRSSMWQKSSGPTCATNYLDTRSEEHTSELQS